jgi:glycosyltransferase involved in cell wall biosynthesis
MYALYRASDVFLSLSEHEGFGLPFIESLVFDLPVVAYKCTAVPHTLGNAGILIDTNDRVDLIGELIQAVVTDEDLRQHLIRGQGQQLKEYKEMNLEAILMRLIKGLEVSAKR